MTIEIYGYGKCSTCVKALRFLEQLGVAFVSKEITVTPPSIAELERMLVYQNGELKKLFNTSGNLYREMNLSQKLPNLSKQGCLELLNQHGMLIKRPFLLGKNFGLLGFNQEKWEMVCKENKKIN